MAIRYIRPVAPNYAEGLVARVYVQTKKEFGALVEPFTLHSPFPELLAGAWSACRESLLVGNVSRAVKETVAATVSRINRCPYCVDAHTIMLNAASAHNSAKAIIHHRDDQIRDPAVRSTIERGQANYACPGCRSKSWDIRGPRLPGISGVTNSCVTRAASSGEVPDREKYL